MNIKIMEIVPLLALQKTMLHQIISQPSCHAYCEQWRYKITGKLDIETMKRAWKDTMDYFDVLHGIFQWKNRKEPVFIIQKESKVICHTYYLQKNIKECEKQMWADEIALREYLNPVDLEDAPIRIAISIFDDSHCEWIVTSNHILFDGWSNSLIMNDWIGRYRTYCCHQIPDHLEQSLSYSDYVRYVCQEQINQQHTEFWQNYLRGCASLPTSTQRGRGKHQVEKIPLSKHEVK